jgi:ribose 5-phosphate isomerase B
MRIAVGADHRGFTLKAAAIKVIEEAGHSAIDLGTDTDQAVDYPDYAVKVADAMRCGDADRGLLLCGSGVGATIAANKIPGIRAGACHDPFSAHQGVEDDDMNVLCLGSGIVGPSLMAEIIEAWLKAEFSGAERHQRRLDKVLDLERRYSGGQGAEDG